MNVNFFNFTDLIREKLKPYYLFVYRVTAFLAISGSLLFLVGWAWIMIFFMFNNSWVAPTVLSKNSDRMLSFSGGYAQSIQLIETDTVMLNQAQRDLKYAKDNVTKLKQLSAHLMSYTNRSARLASERNRELTKARVLSQELDKLQTQASQSRRVGLIDGQTYTQTEILVNQFNGMTLDTSQSLETQDITTQGQILTLDEQLRQAENDVNTKQEMVDASQRALSVATKVVDNLQGSALFEAFNSNNHNVNIAFVPYDNSKSLAGAAIYTCRLEIIWCRQVGTIIKVYDDEQLVEFPLFNIKLSRTERGTFALINLTEKDAYKNLVMFIDKPLGL